MSILILPKKKHCFKQEVSGYQRSVCVCDYVCLIVQVCRAHAYLWVHCVCVFVHVFVVFTLCCMHIK